MSGLALLLVLFVLARAGKEGGGGGGARDAGPPLFPPAAPPPAQLPPIAKAAKKVPAPWPQAVPAGLPPFGRAGWEPDEPPPAQVQARAWQLLAELWKYGSGTHKTEQTAGRWITYQAQPMAKGKKGVVAYRVRGGTEPVTPTNINPNLPMV